MKQKKRVVIPVSIISAVAVFLGATYINHRVKLNEEEYLFQSDGVIVNVNNHKMNVYVSGNSESEYTLVFMSGAGTCSPTLDFRTLYTLFENDYRIAVVEKSGYGFSEDSDSSRDIDTMLDETREALVQAGASDKKYILFPHSMSGIEAMYWANKYPDEIAAVVGLDPATPEAYRNLNINALTCGGQKIIGVASDIGITRLLPFVVNDSAAIKYGTLTDEEKNQYRAVFHRITMSASMCRETAIVKENSEKLAAIDTVDVPVLFFMSNGEGTGFDKETWQNFGVEYVKTKTNGKCVTLDCSHYVHNIEQEKIYAESIEFFSELG